MQDISNCSLDELIEWAERENLLDYCHKNDWQVTLQVQAQVFVLNHTCASIFLQGMLVGAWRDRMLGSWETRAASRAFPS